MKRLRETRSTSQRRRCEERPLERFWLVGVLVPLADLVPHIRWCLLQPFFTEETTLSLMRYNTPPLECSVAHLNLYSCSLRALGAGLPNYGDSLSFLWHGREFIVRQRPSHFVVAYAGRKYGFDVSDTPLANLLSYLW
jgi:hypothetical protein